MISFSPDQLFLVTGASSGIGQASALLLVELGASVVAVGRNLESLEKTREQSTCPQSFHIYARDLMHEPEELAVWIADLRNKHGKFSGFLNCAGTMHMDNLQNYTISNANFLLMLHAQIPLLLTKALLDRRNCIGAGTSVVFIAALGGVISQVGLLGYGAAKAALIASAKNLSKEFGKRRIRINTISPALVRTAMTEKDYIEFMGYDILSAEEPNYPLGLGSPHDVASLAAFLLSSSSSWITGQNIIMDGGRY